MPKAGYIQFTALIDKFGEMGEKTGWTYLIVPEEIARKVKPGNKKIFRVKGALDKYTYSGVALFPRGDGSFIMPINTTMRKGIGKRKGASVQVKMREDNDLVQPPAELLECLQDEPVAKEYFESLTYGHKNYFTKWIESAKTESTKTKRIAMALDALSRKMHFGEMLRAHKKNKNKELG